ncbi:unnamed protein product [Rhizoctonia solani]|uniref:Ribonuclease H1 N-terminal domain-containing protein n=1 Tax=Rhizoctonia solani TaxID=456999 RepID=A0A8H3DZ09_9AGAM|nr:unnamed protein product [Rhizoctonia solani]
MARDVESPYPANAVFAVHKGFRTGVFTEYRDLLAQTADYPGGKEVWAVFTDVQHAREFVSTGKCPVHPIAQHPTVGGVSIPDSSARSLPTPDPSPETDAAPPALPARQLDRPSTSAPLKATVSLPPPAPRKATKVDHDSDGDTEPEDEAKAPSSSLPVAGSAKLHKTPSRQPGWITQALKRDQSSTSTSGTTPRPKNPPTTQPPALSPTKPVVAAAVPSSSAPSRPTHHSRPAAPGSGPFAPPPAPAPMSAPAPTLIPELAQQQRPHGTYEMCGHCHGKGWLMTPAETTSHFSAPQPPVIQTPSRPRAKPTTNLKLVPNPSPYRRSV